ncbi:hypothetical protein GMORB2_7067 [Geosmithia morbida]|uniref:AB hydrolase-1 domain-containing protein n=1 Tax=Geosmithia morbida TaxID=1094350 RepID=A0A9P4YTY3_9HYPO|nr:uncharacterized protein GMORB2_7067 [Geosmithia morbida]KAF4122760.1 hypothetical protein GMORB2_7067 [Geosmithia morbida]
MASNSSPVIVLVPGAFGTPSGFDQILPYLRDAGFSTRPGAYPSCDPPNPATATCADDIAHLRNDVLLPLLQEGQDIVVLVHSYGGVVGGGAAKGLDKASRQSQGLPGGVIGLIYVVGNITLEGESLMEAVGGAYPPFIKLCKPSEHLALIEPAMDVLYNDCDAALAPVLEKSLKPHAHLAFETKATAPAWADLAFDGRRTYVRTIKDACNPAILQDMWIEKSKVRWDVVDFDTGHMPFISQPKALSEQIIKSTKGFM